MSKLRELVKGDRVKITGPWRVDTDGDCGEGYIGEFATVICDDGGSHMPIEIGIDSDEEEGTWWWCREYLKTLPRKGAAK